MSLKIQLCLAFKELTTQHNMTYSVISNKFKLTPQAISAIFNHNGRGVGSDRLAKMVVELGGEIIVKANPKQNEVKYFCVDSEARDLV